jgi:hypothetical protein
VKKTEDGKERQMDKSPLLEGVGAGNLRRVVLARIPIGVDLLEAIFEVVKREKIPKGLILMGIGALQKAVFRNLKVFPKEYPVTPQDRIYFEVENPWRSSLSPATWLLEPTESPTSTPISPRPRSWGIPSPPTADTWTREA